MSDLVLKPDPPSAALGAIIITSTWREGLDTLAQFLCANGMQFNTESHDEWECRCNAVHVHIHIDQVLQLIKHSVRACGRLCDISHPIGSTQIPVEHTKTVQESLDLPSACW